MLNGQNAFNAGGAPTGPGGFPAMGTAQAQAQYAAYLQQASYYGHAQQPAAVGSGTGASPAKKRPPPRRAGPRTGGFSPRG